jgi:hypothetical protein
MINALNSFNDRTDMPVNRKREAIVPRFFCLKHLSLGQQEQTRTEMLPENILNLKVFPNLIASASSLLNLSDRQIWERFNHYPICFIDFYEKEERQKSVEIRFDREQTSITCLFDESNRCDFAFIIPDHLNPLADFVNFFNAIYDFDAVRCRWILANGFLSQKRSKEGVCFMINR